MAPTTGGEPFLRGLLGAVVLLLVARAAEPLFFGNGFYATLAIHPFWIVVILAAVQGGLFVGVATAAVAALSMDWPPRPTGLDITAHLVELAIMPVQWLLAAIVIGGYRQGQIRREAWLAAENVRLRQMSEDLAAEVGRMDDAIAALELRAATREDVGELVARPGGEGDGTTGDLDVAEPGAAALEALAALATARTDAFKARFAEAAAALGFAGAAFHAPTGVPVLAGLAPRLTAPEAETLRRQVAETQIVETNSAEGRQVAVGIGDVGSGGVVATMTLRQGATPGVADQDELDDGSAASARGTAVMSAAEAIARTAVLARAVGFSGVHPERHDPERHDASVLDAGTRQPVA